MSALRRNVQSRLREGGKRIHFALLDESCVEAEHACKPLRQEGRASKWCRLGGLEELIMDRRRQPSVAVAGFAGMSGSADAAMLLPRLWPADAWGRLLCTLPTGSSQACHGPCPSYPAGCGMAALLQGNVAQPGALATWDLTF